MDYFQSLRYIPTIREWESSFTMKLLISVILICLMSKWMHYLWGRRKLYAISSKLEGPLALPLIGCSYLFYGDNYDAFLKLINTITPYKGVVRIWLFNKLLLFSRHYKHIEIFLNHPHAMGKADLYEYLKPVLGTGLITAPVSTWKKQRKVVLKTFHQQCLNDSIPIFVKYGRGLLNQINAACKQGNSEYMIKLLTECTVDIICETGTGIDLTNNQKLQSDFGHHLDICAEVAFLRMLNIFYHFDFVFNITKYSKNVEEACRYFQNLTMNLIRQKRSDMANHNYDYNHMKSKSKNFINESTKPIEDHYSKKNKSIFLDQLINMSSSDQTLSDEYIYGEIMTYIAAGSDTTSFTIGFVMLMLAMHPEIQDLVHKEVINVVDSDRSIEPRDLPQLKYLEQVIKETLRIFPNAAIILRETQAEIDLQDGTIIPEGCDLAIPILLIHRTPDYWPDPLKFDPDRFSPTQIEKIKPYTYLPFSAGPRNCVGAHYAMLNIKTIVSMLIRSFKVITKYNSVEEVELKSHLVLRPRNGFQTYFIPR